MGTIHLALVPRSPRRRTWWRPGSPLAGISIPESPPRPCAPHPCLSLVRRQDPDLLAALEGQRVVDHAENVVLWAEVDQPPRLVEVVFVVGRDTVRPRLHVGDTD